MIVDCFTFYNEINMLQFRIKELQDVVDYFVLVESTETFNRNPKKLYYQEVDPHPNVIHVVVDDMPDADVWQREKHQRNCISRGLERLNLSDSDIIIIGDVDEIPDRETLTNIRRSGIDRIHALKQDMYYYNLTCKVSSDWTHPKIMSYKNYKDVGGAENARFNMSPIIERGGWHFSYFGDVEFISNKIKNFSHQEYNTEEFTDPAKIMQRLNNHEDLFARGKLQHIPVENNTYLPKYYKLLIPEDVIEVDVVCLTNTTDERLHAITSRTLKTLHDSEKKYKFKVHLVETNANSPYLYKGLVTSRITPNEPFNYNRFINLCHPRVTSDWVLVINNDLRFERGWFSKIMEVHSKRPDIESYSPKCPVLYSKYYYDHFLGTEEDYCENYRVTEFLAGWCFVMSRKVWNAVYPWDEQFNLYYQDNDYAEKIKSLGIKHALVRDSIVMHLGSQTLGPLSAEGFGDHETKFRKKWNIWH